MEVADLAVRDYGEIVNALLEGPSVPAIASFRIEWTSSQDKHSFHYPPETFDANVVLTTAQASWEAETATARFVSDASSTSFSLFAEVGHERNGQFFPSV